MKTTLPVFALLLLALPAVSPAQSFYMVSKNQSFVQTSATAVVANPLAPFSFQARTATRATLTLPGGRTAALATDPRDGGFVLAQAFATKTALDDAFPNGTYRLTGPALPTLTLALATDTYPTTTPQITGTSNGTWNSGGLLVVDPAQSVTLDFAPFSGYATSGVAGHIHFSLSGMTDNANDHVQLETDLFSQPIFGAPAQPTPLTSYTIPAGRLIGGRIYRVALTFDTVTTINLTAVPGSAVGTLFSKELSFYLTAQTTGTSTPPPVITTPLAHQTAVIGGSATFSLAMTMGGMSLFNQPFVMNWTLNGRDLGDMNMSGGKHMNSGGMNGGPGLALTINNLTAADAGDYAVTIVTAGGIATSSPATLTLAPASAPAFATQPRGVTVNAGSTVALAATAAGSPTPSYQWRKDNLPIPGATTDTLILPAVAASTAGNYTVLVANSLGSLVSNSAAVAVTIGQPSRLPNLSVRTNLAAAQTLTVGFATVGAKTMLVRGVGPTLGAFGLTGVLPDPTIELFNSTAAKIDENNDWNPALAPVFTEVGAFALTAGGKDAALQRFCTGANTALIKSTGAGVVLVEVYDAGGPGKLVNVSARNVVGTGENLLITGFVVDGTAAKTLLIRGVGAKLAEFGVTGVLADPKLEIYNAAGIKIAENDSWSTQLQPIARSVGAFDLTLGSRDAALLLTLAPGNYTAQISGVGATTGEAIVEVYDVP